MNLFASLLLGLLNIALVIAVCVLIVLVIIHGAAYLGFPIPDQIQKVLWFIVGLIALIMLVTLLLSLVGGAHFPFRVIGTNSFTGGTIAALSAGTTIDL